MKKLLITVLLLALPAVAMNSYTVTSGGSIGGVVPVVGTPGNCVAGTGWLTIPNAGACIHVGVGTYAGPITTTHSGTATARVVYISDTRWGAKVTTANWQNQADYVDVDGFDLTSPATGNNFGFSTGAHLGVHFLYNNAHDFDVAGCGQFGAVNTGVDGSTTSHDAWIIGNVVRHAGNQNVSATGGSNGCNTLHGIYALGDGDLIENNIISGITGWGIKRGASGNVTVPGVISNNTVFSNGGGIIIDQCHSSCTTFDFNTISNNIVVLNGDGTQNRYGVDWYHVTGTNNLATSNLIYGNLPHDQAHHDVQCGTDATTTTPVVGVAIPANSNDTTGCPQTNPQTDSNLNGTATFVNFRPDKNLSPDPSYDPNNYKLKSSSNAVGKGASPTTCASGGGAINPCVATSDFYIVPRPTSGAQDIGFAVFNQSVAPPTNVTATVN